MKKTTQTGKLKLGKNVIARLNEDGKQSIKGGLPRLPYTKASVCTGQCCQTDYQYC